MKAVTFQGIKNVKVKDVPAPKIQKNDDIIVKITSSAICGSDLHLIHDMVPNLPQNYIIGLNLWELLKKLDQRLQS